MKSQRQTLVDQLDAANAAYYGGKDSVRYSTQVWWCPCCLQARLETVRGMEREPGNNSSWPVYQQPASSDLVLEKCDGSGRRFCLSCQQVRDRWVSCERWEAADAAHILGGEPAVRRMADERRRL